MRSDFQDLPGVETSGLGAQSSKARSPRVEVPESGSKPKTRDWAQGLGISLSQPLNPGSQDIRDWAKMALEPLTRVLLGGFANFALDNLHNEAPQEGFNGLGLWGSLP